MTQPSNDALIDTYAVDGQSSTSNLMDLGRTAPFNMLRFVDEKNNGVIDAIGSVASFDEKQT